MKGILDLREAYVVEPYLSRDIVKRYFSLGPELLYHMIQTESFCVELTLFENKIISEIINGCHRAKAALKHGIYQLEIEYVNSDNDLAQGSEGIRLVEVPEINKHKYKNFIDVYNRV